MHKSAFVISDRPDFATKIVTAIRPALPHVQIAAYADVAKRQERDSFLVIDTSCVKPDSVPLLRQLAQQNTVMLVADHEADRVISLMVDIPEVNHIFGMFHDRNSNLLLSAIRQNMQSPVNAFDSYLGSAAAVNSAELRDYRSSADIVANIRAAAAETGAFSELGNIVATVSSEMIMNACFDAPIDRKTGKPKYAHLPRTTELRLGDDERVAIRYGHNRDSFVISVKDNFGALKRQTVVENLARCAARGTDQIRYEAGGAGIGLYMLFKYSSQLDFRVVPGVSTEVVTLISLSKRLKEYEMSGPCVNFFVKDAR